MNLPIHKSLRKRIALIVSTGLTFAMGSSFHAQSPAKDAAAPVFDVVSIKPVRAADRVNGLSGCHGSDSKYPALIQIAPPPTGHCVFHGYSLKSLISYETGLRSAYIIGGANWTESDLFEIDAKPPEGVLPTEDHFKQMLLGFLADQFKLRFHRETREIPGYALVVAKGGPKIKPATGAETPAGMLRMAKRMAGQNIPMSAFADTLWNNLKTPVVDKTGLMGNYTFTLNLDTGGELQLPEALPADSTVSIFTSLPDQLGLRLEPQKIPVDFFVIEAVEKPAGR